MKRTKYTINACGEEWAHQPKSSLHYVVKLMHYVSNKSEDQIQLSLIKT